MQSNFRIFSERYFLYLIFTVVLLSVAVSCRQHGISGVVLVEGGYIQGTVGKDMTVFKGIPFAAPPIGELRWKAPQPVGKWDGILMTTEFAKAPVQATDDMGSISEDCLYLNIWTPAKSDDEGLPVMVWIYGGGFSQGATSYSYSDGEALARRGVIVVSIAYRVGYLGFLAHPALSGENEEGVSGNYGLLDQIAALQWIQRNINAFGGNPDNVTLFGQSAGGISISMLCASPLAKGLFRRAISESGGSFSAGREDSYPGENMRTLAMAEKAGERYAETLGARTSDELRNLDYSVFARPYNATGGAWPNIDGYVIPDDQYRLYESGNFNDVDILIGYNSDEGASFAEKESDGYIRSVHERFGEYADELLNAYPLLGGDTVNKSARDLLRDASFGWHTWTWACLQTEKGKSNVFMYYFDQHPAAQDRTMESEIGSPHGYEVGYVFQHADNCLQGDDVLNRQIGAYWTNFAKTGNPNGCNLPEWPQFTSAGHQVMYLTGKGCHAGPVPDEESLKVLDRYFAWRRNR